MLSLCTTLFRYSPAGPSFDFLCRASIAAVYVVEGARERVRKGFVLCIGTYRSIPYLCVIHVRCCQNAQLLPAIAGLHVLQSLLESRMTSGEPCNQRGCFGLHLSF